ncbi:MAG: hypothetical protein IT304_07930 [Dehalococcoidia bacterium]|nr:hypothetical protein [Dehalococcoidia bacterium]
MNDENESGAIGAAGERGSLDSPDAWPGEQAVPARSIDDLDPVAADRIRRFMADATIRGGASPGDVASLYTSQEIVDDADATAYLDQRFVHGEMPAGWRTFQDLLSTAFLDGEPSMTADALLALVRHEEGRRRTTRSIFDDPEDDDDTIDDARTTRMEERDPHLADLSDEARRAIERQIISEVLCYGIAPYKVMQLREWFRTDGDERALQYLDLPFELGDRPSDWDSLRDRALMVRARLERRGLDPAAAFGQVEANQPAGEVSSLLLALDDLPRPS